MNVAGHLRASIETARSTGTFATEQGDLDQAWDALKELSGLLAQARESAEIPGGEPAALVWTGDPSSAPLGGEADDHALDDAGEALDRAIFGAMLYAL